MNRGDTVYLMLNYKVNGYNLVEGAYEEIELQINNATSNKSIRKLLSKGDIKWEKVSYTIDGSPANFTGYTVHLDQSETFLLSAGKSTVQLRIKKDGEVGSSEISGFSLGMVLSDTVI